MKKIESYWWKILAVGIILIVAWKVLDFSNVKSWIKSAFDIMMPFIIGAVLAFFTNKPSKAIEEFLKRKAKRLSKKAARVISVLSVYAVLIAILAFSLNFLIPALYVNMQDLVKNAPSYYETIKNFTDNSEFLSSLGILDKISESVMSYINFSMMGKFVGIVSSVANSVLTFFLGIILSIYILLEKESLANFFKTLGKLVLKGKHSATVAMYCGEFAKLFNSYFLGLMFDALLMGVLSSIFFALFGAPFICVILSPLLIPHRRAGHAPLISEVPTHKSPSRYSFIPTVLPPAETGTYATALLSVFIVVAAKDKKSVSTKQIIFFLFIKTRSSQKYY